MSLDIRIMTWIVLAIPLALFTAALGAPPPTRLILLGVTAFVVLTYASVALWWRPLRFEVGGHRLALVWPLRSRLVEGRQIAAVEIVPRAEFRRRYGWGYRVGAGGLWGGFGLLVTSRESFAILAHGSLRARAPPGRAVAALDARRARALRGGAPERGRRVTPWRFRLARSVYHASDHAALF